MPAKRDRTSWLDTSAWTAILRPVRRCHYRLHGQARKYRTFLIRFTLLAALALLSSSAWADSEVVLIANPNVRIETMSRDTARAIFAMRQRTWPNGQAASVFVLPDENEVHAQFSKSLLDVYPHQLRLAWDRVVFSGTGQAPNRVFSQTEMLEHVASTPGGLGYIERGYLDDSVKVIPLAN